MNPANVVPASLPPPMLLTRPNSWTRGGIGCSTAVNVDFESRIGIFVGAGERYKRSRATIASSRNCYLSAGDVQLCPVYL